MFPSGLTAAPRDHGQAHVPEVIEAIPTGAREQLTLLPAKLDRTLESAGWGGADGVNLIRFFTGVERDQDPEWFGGHAPTSTSAEDARLATDARLRIEIQAVVVRGEV
ncbi:hypothetical protein [Amycolatopsis sp. FDAARGOS 1241]|uniref:hypothetical protein n=1 Tax=Amycolatopsis sp. FDAARGOS 1241 TaxID=2778070 RepID=UPI001951A284|nr:hypothetical protein [Amycolatopsis sp. FDAARGOS 1241]QRP47401.1 hypothetical protein I6J71_05365 [Amycolatopsis sp. FDAARGOS 1241]